jgi:short subunit dehydrogenase-like uncharacterized protein
MVTSSRASKTRTLIYGAYGYTGQLTAELAASRHVDVVLAGRNREALTQLGARLNLPTRVVGLDDAEALANALHDVRSVIHMAGPFALTAQPMLNACLTTQTNYVDITGEIAVFEAIWSRRAEIEHAGITAVPGSGFDVVPSDCVAAHVASRLERPSALVLAFRGLDSASRGTLQTAIRDVSTPVLCRRGGKIVPLEDRSPRSVDFGSGAEPCLPVSWGDVATAFYSTGADDITVYFRQTALLRSMAIAQRRFGRLLGSALVQRVLTAAIRRAPEGPTEPERRRHRTTVWAEAVDRHGRRVRSALSTHDPYEFTANSVLEITRRIHALSTSLGVVTPSQAFGAEFALAVPGCSRVDAS